MTQTFCADSLTTSTLTLAEYEFYQFRAPKSANEGADDRNSSATARFLKDNKADNLPHLTEGMMGYSLFDPVRNQDWFYEVFEACDKFNCGIEGWHTESGPGVYEAVWRLCPSNIDTVTKTDGHIGSQFWRDQGYGGQGSSFQVS